MVLPLDEGELEGVEWTKSSIKKNKRISDNA
jgi:hypothetical protein